MGSMFTALRVLLARTTARRPDAQRGATAVEYAIMASLVAVAIIGGVFLFGHAVLGLFNSGATATTGIG